MSTSFYFHFWTAVVFSHSGGQLWLSNEIESLQIETSLNAKWKFFKSFILSSPLFLKSSTWDFVWESDIIVSVSWVAHLLLIVLKFFRFYIWMKSRNSAICNFLFSSSISNFVAWIFFCQWALGKKQIC